MEVEEINNIMGCFELYPLSKKEYKGRGKIDEMMQEKSGSVNNRWEWPFFPPCLSSFLSVLLLTKGKTRNAPFCHSLDLHSYSK